MSTIIPEGKNLRNALAWVEEGLKEGKRLDILLTEAGMRFNLAPLEDQFLAKFYRKKIEANR
ncbi:MAG: hypothetical protein EOM25_11325 [Deltaproteobacteria bacterium]|nr:hypothetical protein [Deltaproteobacteria bacterium]